MPGDHQVPRLPLLTENALHALVFVVTLIAALLRFGVTLGAAFLAPAEIRSHRLHRLTADFAVARLRAKGDHFGNSLTRISCGHSDMSPPFLSRFMRCSPSWITCAPSCL